ncbi:GTP-binding protein [Microbacterium amylolyticum]|uniref:G3E family GTPase n=1 Tax=Microbacterium amylolyticum TaxID=936337 RepID=A0ABS4ZI92_9MICO|nr:GTP-binding protein [Microbacterium amylolyticum]MBP2436987.1 G3E family GTPase [Microbacterium amylolyticum]
MEQVDVVAVMGTCIPERGKHGVHIAQRTGRTFFPAHRIAVSPDPVDEAQALAAWADGPGGAVVEFPASVAPTEIIGRFAHPTSSASLVGLVCVVDAPHLLDDIARDDYLVHRSPDGDRVFRARALATVTQIEYATTVVLINWDALSTPELSTMLALISALSPRVRTRLHPSPYDAPEQTTPLTAVQDRPGWIALLNDDFEPHMTDDRVSALRFQSVRPFHPARLEKLLDTQIEAGAFGSVLRSAGFCRLATRPGVTAHWEHVGSMLSLPPVSRDDELEDDEEMLAAGQDIALFGLDLDRPALARAFGDATLTDEEFAQGPAVWMTYDDPFPAWAVA